MILPIISSISRELFLGVPHELKEGALALGTTRWEMVRGVVFPYARGGIAAAMILGLGRALGEAIAVTQVIGGVDNAIQRNLFANGDTIGSKIAVQFLNAASNIEKSSLIYLGLILLVFSLVVNLLAQVIVRRSRASTGAWRHECRRARRRFGAPNDRLRRRRAVNRLHGGPRVARRRRRRRDPRRSSSGRSRGGARAS